MHGDIYRGQAWGLMEYIEQRYVIRIPKKGECIGLPIHLIKMGIIYQDYNLKYIWLIDKIIEIVMRQRSSLLVKLHYETYCGVSFFKNTFD